MVRSYVWAVVIITAVIIAYRSPTVVDPSLDRCGNLIVLEQRQPSDFLPGICRLIFVEQQNILSAVYDCGPATGKEETIVLLHGFPDNAKTWRRQVETFIQNGYRVVIPTLRGYNTYSHSYECHVTVLANDVLCVVKALEIESFHLIGHDWGAIIGHVLTITNYRMIDTFISVAVPPIYTVQAGRIMLTYPGQLINSLYMLFFQLPVLPELAIKHTPFLYFIFSRWSPTTSWYSDPHYREVVETFRESSVIVGAFLFVFCFANDTNPLRPAFCVALLSPKYSLFAMGRHPIRGKVNVNTLLVSGKDDQCVMTEIYDLPMDRFFRANYEVHRIDGGHFVHYENPSVFNELALNFIRRTEVYMPGKKKIQ